MAKREDVQPAAAVQSVDRALLVLEILANLGQAGVTEIAAELGVHKSTVSRLIAVLEVTRLRRTSIGPRQVPARVLDCPAGPRQQRAARSGQAQPGRLRRAAAEGRDHQCGDPRRRPDHQCRRGDRPCGDHVADLGRSELSRACDVSGKVLLAGLDPADVRSRLGAALEAFTDHTMAKTSDLQRNWRLSANEDGQVSVKSSRSG